MTSSNHHRGTMSSAGDDQQAKQAGEVGAQASLAAQQQGSSRRGRRHRSRPARRPAQAEQQQQPAQTASSDAPGAKGKRLGPHMEQQTQRRRMFGRAREVSHIPEVDSIGEFSVKQVLRSLSKVGPATLVRFDYKGPDEAMYLCWIDPEGQRHHSYPRSGTEWSHQENTHAGHAFAIFRKRDGKLIASYRLIAALAEGQIHVVDIPDLRAKAENILVEARVIAEFNGVAEFPSQDDWKLEYVFSVPQLPSSDKPEFFETNTVYVWGDLSFDEFSLEDGRRPIHTYKMNQIVPQVMCGECLCGSDPVSFTPYWKTFKRWVAQAQHYYQDARGESLGSHAVCGDVFEVEPGERMKTTIAFENQKQMRIRIESLDHPDHVSEIITQNPFPNDPNIFPGGWQEFFRRKERHSTKTFRAYPCFNIEYKAQDASLDVLRAMCPFKVHKAVFPGFSGSRPEEMTAKWHVRGMNFELADNHGEPLVTFGE